VFDTSESGSTEQEVAARRFERLARVRAEQRARRRRHVGVAALVVIGLAGGVVLVRAVWSGSSTDRAAELLTTPSSASTPGPPSASGTPEREPTTRSGAAEEAPAPLPVPKPPASLAAAPASGATAASPAPATTRPSPGVTALRPIAPPVAAPAPPASAGRDVRSRRVPGSPSPTHDVNAIPRAAVATPETDDSTAIIDWLLHSPPTQRR
jgi:hypothetical protein